MCSSPPTKKRLSAKPLRADGFGARKMRAKKGCLIVDRSRCDRDNPVRCGDVTSATVVGGYWSYASGSARRGVEYLRLWDTVGFMPARGWILDRASWLRDAV